MSASDETKSLTSQEIEYEHAVIESKLKELGERVVDLVTTELNTMGQYFLSSTHRVKALDSLIVKVKEKSKRSLDDVRDLVGVRVVTLFDSDIDGVCDAISRVFDVNEKDDRREKKNPSEFGYSAVYFLVQLKRQEMPNETGPSPEGAKVWRNNILADSRIVCEIQVRTILQDVWAQVSHPVYKIKESSEVPARLSRKLSRIAAFLEVADEELDRLKTDRARFFELQNTDIRHQKIEAISLISFLEKAFPELPVGNKIESIVNGIDRVKYSKICDLINFLESETVHIEIEKWVDVVGPFRISSQRLYAALMLCDQQFLEAQGPVANEQFFFDRASALSRRNQGFAP